MAWKGLKAPSCSSIITLMEKIHWNEPSKRAYYRWVLQTLKQHETKNWGLFESVKAFRLASWNFLRVKESSWGSVKMLINRRLQSCGSHYSCSWDLGPGPETNDLVEVYRWYILHLRDSEKSLKVFIEQVGMSHSVTAEYSKKEETFKM